MSGIKKIGVLFGVLAFLICLLAGSIVMCPAIEKCPVVSMDTGIGAFFIGTGFFFASLLILIGSQGSGSGTVKKSRPVKTAVKKKAPAAKGKAPAKSSAKPA